MTELTNAPQKKQYFLPDLADIIFLVILWLILFIKENMLLADGSTGWHLVTGNYILQHHNIPHTDIMSYTFANKAWVAYEWLSDVLMAVLVKLGGLNLLNVVVASAIAFLVFLLYGRCRENGCNFAFAGFLSIIGAAIAAIHWLARPHIFTFFGVYIFSTLLERFHNNAITKKKLATALCLYMLLWANTHPAFLLGFVLIGIYLASSICKYFFLKPASTEAADQDKNRIKFLSFLLVLNVVASLCNPYGYHLYSYVANYLFKTNMIVAATDEFLSPIFHGAIQPLFLELLFALTIVGLVITKTKINLPSLLVYIVFAHLSLSAQRNMALYVIVALPFIARLYSSTQLDSNGGAIYNALKPSWQGFINRANILNIDFTEMERLCSYHLLPIITTAALILIAINSGKAFCCTYLQADFDKESKPDTTLTAIKQLHLDPYHGFSLDNWGGVIRYKLDYPVFIDDRADFYGQDFYLNYGKIIQLYPGWQSLLQKYQINWILLPKNSRLIEELKRDNNWKTAAEDQASVLIIKTTNTPD